MARIVRCSVRGTTLAPGLDMRPLGEARIIDQQALDIVVVDDEVAIAELLVELLGQEGYRAVWAPTAHAGLREVARGSPRLILTDVMLPGMSGPALLECVDGMDLDVAPRSILMSAAPPPASAPADVPFVRKPFDLDDLLGVVRVELAKATDAVARIIHQPGSAWSRC